MLNSECDCLEQASMPVEEQIHTSRRRVLHVPQFIQGKLVLILWTVLGITFVLSISLISLSLKNNSEMSKYISMMNVQWLYNMSKEAESKKELSYLQGSAVALMADWNLTLSVLEELTVMKRENGRIAKDVTQVKEELQSFTVALMAKGNSTASPSVLEELAAMKRENSRIAKDVTQVREELKSFTVSLMTNRTGSASVLEELADLKRENGRTANNVIQILEELHNFTELFCSRCPQNWLPFQKNCYFFSSLRKPWRVAKQSCENEGAHLVIINNLPEQNFLVGQVANEQVFWIGLSDTDKEGKWLWVDGTPISIFFWGTGEPNNAGAGQGIYMLASAPPLPSKADSLSHLDDDYDDGGIVTPMVHASQTKPLAVEERRDKENQKAVSISEPAQGKDHRRLCIVIPFVLVAISFAMCAGVLTLVLLKYSAMSEELQALNLNYSETLTRVKKDLDYVQATQKISERTISNSFSELWDIAVSTCEKASISHRCPTKWETNGKNCYYFSMEKKNWTDALWYCINEKAHLVSIWSDEEEGFLKNKLSDTSIYWLGMTDLETEGKWRWREGGLSASTSFWDKGEPQKGEDKNCGIMHPSGTWASAMCSLPYRWICKKKLIC